jgi:hypothetical protein
MTTLPGRRPSSDFEHISTIIARILARLRRRRRAGALRGRVEARK